jgi:16S rRNA (cytosine1407-C5)-methyltransferase
MTKKKIDKTAIKQQAWTDRTMDVLHMPYDTVDDLLRIPRQQSLRINTLRTNNPEFIAKELQLAGIAGAAYTWAPHCLHLNVPIQEVRDHPLVTDGTVFIQNAASWLPVLALDPRQDERILDVCAAPGGKTSHIAAITQNTAEIWVNDNSRPRLAKMRVNFERLGVQITETMLFDARLLARKLPDTQFDRILLDAPCSGEGLMQLDRPKDFATWSVAHIKRLQQLQKHLIMQAWQLLKPGGTLVYSTCTMAPEENEAVVDYLLRKSDRQAQLEPIILDVDSRVPTVMEWQGKRFAPELANCLRLKPSTEIEAFFVAKIVKSSSAKLDMLQ